MNEITLENYRCFREGQVVRLAPLTLLVGENSTGKTSFMAMIRALWNVAYKQRVPDFNEEPYDLGSFDGISHRKSQPSGQTTRIKAGFGIASGSSKIQSSQDARFNVTFEKRGTVPTPVSRRIAKKGMWAEVSTINSSHKFQFKISNDNVWKAEIPNYKRKMMDAADDLLPSFTSFLRRLQFGEPGGGSEEGSESFRLFDRENFMLGMKLVRDFEGRYSGRMHYGSSLYASAPVRSKPRRIYDLSRLTHEIDPEGDYIPMYFAKLYFSDRGRWNELRASLEDFGQRAGLFDEVSVTSLGKQESGVFQVQIRKFDRRRKGPKHNLVDVGYGVSQVLPIVTELLRPDRPALFLYQQPEVHLHPSAQAALGSLFCQIAGRRCQLIVETHSDHLLDRVRMDIRDGESKLKPEDVSILFFQRDGLDVRIHALQLDDEGNVLDAPDGYRRFFLEETARSIWKRPL